MHTHLSSIFILLFVKLSISQEVTATQKIPENILPGTEYIAEITINQGMNTSYLKFSQRLPPSFIASEMDSKNGKFSFKDGLVKIAWIFPPTEKEFTISFKVIVAKEDSGEKIIKGRVYYFFNTHKEFFQLLPQKITVSNENKTVEKDTILTIEDIKQTKNNLVSNTDSLKDTVLAAIDNAEKTQTNVLLNADSTKNISPAKTEPISNTTSSEIPTEEIIANKLKTYRVQILAIKEKKYTEIPEIFFITDDNGITKYFSGNFSTYKEATVRKEYLISIGFEGAFIVTFENGDIIKKD